MSVALFDPGPAEAVGNTVRVSVLALPDDAHPIIHAARGTWACWRAMESLGFDLSCAYGEQHERCQPEDDGDGDLHWLAWGNGEPRAWEYTTPEGEDGDGEWRRARVVRFEPGLDLRYETAVVEVERL